MKTLMTHDFFNLANLANYQNSLKLSFFSEQLPST